MSLGEKFIKEHPELLEEASSKVLKVAEEVEHEMAAGEIAKYIATGLKTFADARDSDLDVQVWYDMPYCAFQIRVRFKFNGYVYGVDRMLRDEDMEAGLESVSHWRAFLDHEVRILHDELWVGLQQNGITSLPKKPPTPVQTQEWFEAKGGRGPRGAPASAPLGTIHTDLFGEVWIFAQGGWVTQAEAKSHLVPTMAELIEEQNRVTKQQQDDALAAIVASVRALAPPECDPLDDVQDHHDFDYSEHGGVLGVCRRCGTHSQGWEE